MRRPVYIMVAVEIEQQVPQYLCHTLGHSLQCVMLQSPFVSFYKVQLKCCIERNSPYNYISSVYWMGLCLRVSGPFLTVMGRHHTVIGEGIKICYFKNPQLLSRMIKENSKHILLIISHGLYFDLAVPTTTTKCYHQHFMKETNYLANIH